jgi:hypothetical protein
MDDGSDDTSRLPLISLLDVELNLNHDSSVPKSDEKMSTKLITSLDLSTSWYFSFVGLYPPSCCSSSFRSCIQGLWNVVIVLIAFFVYVQGLLFADSTYSDPTVWILLVTVLLQGISLAFSTYYCNHKRLSAYGSRSEVALFPEALSMTYFLMFLFVLVHSPSYYLVYDFNRSYTWIPEFPGTIRSMFSVIC